MFNVTISSALSSLVPFWSNEIVKSLSLGNEYAMAINMILMEIISISSSLLTDTISMMIVGCLILIFSLKYFNINIFDMITNINKKHYLSVVTIEKIENNDIVLYASQSFNAINHMLIKKYKFNKLRYLNDSNFDILVDTIKNLKLENDLFVNVDRTVDKTTICLSSYKKNLHDILNNALELYCDNNNIYKLKLVGTENNGTSYNYPKPMLCLTYVLINVYKMNKLKILADINNVSGDDENKHLEQIKSSTKTSKEITYESTKNLSNNLKSIYLLENCKNYKLEEDIYITIERRNNVVTYSLSSNTTDLKKFLKKCIDTYKINVSVSDYKYKVKLVGYESVRMENITISYPTNLMALCNKLIVDNIVNDYKIIKHRDKEIKIIEDIHNLLIDDVLINTNVTVQSPNYWENYICKTFILESNTVNPIDFLEKCMTEYTEYLDNKNKNIIYYFKYLGKIDGKLKFNKTILSSNIHK